MNQLYKDLCRVKALLVDGWGQGRERNETRLCLMDAVWRVQPTVDPGSEGENLSDAIYAELAKLDVFSAVDWNDAPGRTKAEVVDLVQRAANRAAGGNAAPVSTDANA